MKTNLQTFPKLGKSDVTYIEWRRDFEAEMLAFKKECEPCEKCFIYKRRDFCFIKEILGEA